MSSPGVVPMRRAPPDQMPLPPWRGASCPARFFPGMQPSPESYGRENLLLFDELVGRRLQYAQVLGDLRDFHEAVGRVVRFGCREGSTSPSLLPGILAAFRIFTDIPETSGNASRDIWRVSPFAGRPYRLSSCIWCSRFHLASKGAFLDGRIGMQLLEGARAEPHGVLVTLRLAS